MSSILLCVTVTNLYSVFFVERCIRLVDEENTLIKANLDFNRALSKFFHEISVNNVVKCTLFYVIVKGV